MEGVTHIKLYTQTEESESTALPLSSSLRPLIGLPCGSRHSLTLVVFKACPTSPKCLNTPTPFQTKTIHTIKKRLFLAHTLKYYSLANYYIWRYCLKLLLLTRAEGISLPYFASVLLTKACFYNEQSNKTKLKHTHKKIGAIKATRLYVFSKLLWRVDLKIFIKNHKLCSGRLQSVRYFIMNVNICHQIIPYPNDLCCALSVIIAPLIHCILSVDLFAPAVILYISNTV